MAESEALHVVRIKHDAASHEIEDCHDDCQAEVVCMGVTDACRVWWECDRCRKVMERLGDEDWQYDDRMSERTSAHGLDHEQIDGMWMTPSDQCLIQACDEHDAGDLVRHLTDGEYPVDLEWEEGYVLVRLLPPDSHEHYMVREANECPTCNPTTPPANSNAEEA